MGLDFKEYMKKGLVLKDFLNIRKSNSNFEHKDSILLKNIQGFGIEPCIFLYKLHFLCAKFEKVICIR